RDGGVARADTYLTALEARALAIFEHTTRAGDDRAVDGRLHPRVAALHRDENDGGRVRDGHGARLGDGRARRVLRDDREGLLPGRHGEAALEGATRVERR